MENTDAKDQAKAQYESICEMVAALAVDYDELKELREVKDALLKAIKYARTEDELREAEDDWQDWETRHDLDLEELIKEANECASRDEAQERIQEDPLSVQVRSAWLDPNDEPFFPAEFEVLLCTGGPAVRIVGELNQYKEPCRAWLEYQDWGTPWTRWFGAEEATLLVYCRNFYYGG